MLDSAYRPDKLLTEAITPGGNTVTTLKTIAIIALLLLMSAAAEAAPVPLIRSAQSGPWSAAETWEGGQVPGTDSKRKRKRLKQELPDNAKVRRR